ncbi:similar to Saccharomyces cerevisiae YDR423C CAD1 AP-1-like basic leucine zipper (bZIP) transcriptional activator involved in stress responses [Maudiozyma saulgeensis]|uniref:Similar to Saccharomyces cerevisiae YDR423C CAD1 AP-1-like basic leucine zipper (BZIP) transcriptional activator involved in stress responses n=1 Tax=Maudiozyma saulgeensis TaxID=1789683 RepID=A0A1X7QWL1_9SACH|nr:similar to Saccharomyces cerevisiae YDR423C CAD1 AP-1-like basic leucine zipper (bZIP) transcriptional activator involved in stress responses [Kazachstania saulgeensis]
MSTTAAKRPLDISGTNVSVETVDELIKNDNEDEMNNTAKKSHHSSKNSKTPLDEETKNKRTAQNRAAQRAFRERKERKMKELEEKVNHLQDIHKQSEIESEFLRGQLFTLVKELKKFRPETSNDSEVLNYLAQHEVNDDENNNSNNNLLNSLTPPENNNNSSKEIKLQKNIDQKKNFSFSYPFNSKTANSNSNNIPSPDGSSTYSSPNQTSTTKNIDESKFVANNNNFFSNDFGSINSPNNSNNINNTTTDASTPSMNWLDNIFYNDNMFNQQINGNDNNLNRKPSSSIASLGNPSNYDSNMLSNEFNFDERFDEQVTDFCVKMNQVCGTKDHPIPKATSPSEISSTNTPQNALTSDSMTNTNITIPSSVGSMSKKLSFGEIGYQNSINNTLNNITPDSVTSKGLESSTDSVDNIPFINDALAFPTESNDLMTQPRLNNDTPDSLENIKPTLEINNNFDTADLFRTPGSSGINNDIFNQFLQDDDDEDNSDNERNPLEGLINEGPSGAPEVNNTSSSKPAPCDTLPVVDANDDDDDANAVVPSKDDDLLKCSEIWDRITSHPKYSDIDIDGLCGELMSKAKCSERGVVVNASDVQLALSKHMA